MKRAVIFAGTSDGRWLAEHLLAQDWSVFISVATEYGAQILSDEKLKIQCGRMDEQEMRQWLSKVSPDVVIDATHPFATEVSANIRRACENLQLRLYRLLRKEPELPQDCYVVENMQQAGALADRMAGTIFLTIGSKELHTFLGQVQDVSRVYARVLATGESVELCRKAGLKAGQIICMQGPFSTELNTAMYRSVHADILVTKDSGKRGGLSEKLAASKALGMKTIVIQRPEETGDTMESLCEKLGVCLPQSPKKKRRVALVGIGMGTPATLTEEAKQAFLDAGVVFGAERMLKLTQSYAKKQVCEYRPAQIIQYLDEHTQISQAAVALSGDVGFYSGAAALQEQLADAGYEVVRICGISSLVQFAARVNLPWQSLCLTSSHGRDGQILAQVRTHFRTFSLFSSVEQLNDILDAMRKKQMTVKAYLGFDLGYEKEEIRIGSLAELTDFPADHKLCVAIFENSGYDDCVTSYADDCFVREEKVPMTKQEVRSVVLAKLGLNRDSIVYDIGAGTGAVTMDIARSVTEGSVYAIEKNPAAIRVLRENASRLADEQVHLIEGTAPEALEGLPTPTHAFIGGSGGHLDQIVGVLLKKNPRVRIVADAITLETVAQLNALLKETSIRKLDCCQIQVSRARSVGGYELMTAQNPVYIFTFTGAEDGI